MSLATQESGSEVDDGNGKLERQGCHPFYESVIEGCYSNRVRDLLFVFIFFIQATGFPGVLDFLESP